MQNWNDLKVENREAGTEHAQEEEAQRDCGEPADATKRRGQARPDVVAPPKPRWVPEEAPGQRLPESREPDLARPETPLFRRPKRGERQLQPKRHKRPHHRG